MTSTVNRRSMMRNALSAYGYRGLWGLSVLLLTPYLFRQLGVGGFGVWSVVLTFSAIIGLVELGFSRGVVKVVAELLAEGKRAELQETLGAATAVYAGMGVLALGVGLAVSAFAAGLAGAEDRHDFQVAMIVLGAGRLVSLLLAGFPTVLAGYQRYDLANTANAVSTLVFSVGAVVLVEAGLGVPGVTIAFVVGAVVGNLLAAAFVRRLDSGISLRPAAGLGAVRPLTAFGSFVLLSDSMIFIGQRMDTLVIAAIRSAAAAGPFAAALKLQTALQSLTLPVVYLLMPMMSELWAHGRKAEVTRRLALATRASVQATVPVAVGVALFAEEAVDLWLGEQAPAVTAAIVVVLMAAGVVTLAAAPAEQGLVGIGRVRALGLLALFEGVANLALSVALVWRYGAIGAAFGTLATSGLLSPVKVPLLCRTLGVRTAEFLRASVVPAVVGSTPALLAMLAVRLLLPEGTARLLVGLGLGLALATIVGVVQIGPRVLTSALASAGRAPATRPELISPTE